MIKIGDVAKDIITGFEGAVVAYAKHLHNCDRAALQPRELKDGEPAKTLWFDVPQLELVQADVVPVIAPAESEIKLGDDVADTLSDFKGKVTAINTWINGCLRLGVMPNRLKDGLPVDEAWIPVTQLRLINQAPPAESKKVGGPMRDPKRISNPR